MKIIINGILGRMGQAITKKIMNTPGLELLGGIDTRENATLSGMTIATGWDGLAPQTDIIIDFSSPAGMLRALDAAVEHGKTLISGTTGLDEKHHTALENAARHIPVLYASNFSLGVNMMFFLLQQAMTKMKQLDFDIEVVETHHRNKKDAPSGTAKTLVDIIQKNLPKPLQEEYGRHGFTDTRDGKLGIHSLRGGSVIGTHDVLFLGKNENLTLSHEALSRHVFVDGILESIKFLQHKPAGLYSMRDVLNLSE